MTLISKDKISTMLHGFEGPQQQSNDSASSAPKGRPLTHKEGAMILPGITLSQLRLPAQSSNLSKSLSIGHLTQLLQQKTNNLSINSEQTMSR